MMKSIFSLTLLLSFFMSYEIVAQVCKPIDQNEVWDLIAHVGENQTHERVTKISAKLLEKPYKGGPAGEGEEGDFSKKPMATIECFDCTTYIETVMALALTKNSSNKEDAFEEFNRNIRHIKYTGDKKVSYENRNHFPELDWTPDLNEKGILKEITLELLPDSPMREKTISKRDWYANKTCADIYYPGQSGEQIDELLKNLKAIALKMNAEGDKVSLPYIPLANCLNKEFQDSLPDMAVFNLVKNEHTKINIPVAVSHQGFIMRKADGKLYLRHANTKDKKVSDVLFEDYVKERMADTTWPTLGFNFQEIK